MAVYRLLLKVSAVLATKEIFPLMTCPWRSSVNLTMDQSQQLLLQLHQVQLLQHVRDLDSSAPMAHALTQDMFVTTKMIVEMVLMKPAVVCNKQAIVKSTYTCILIVVDGISSHLNSALVVTMANNDLSCNRHSLCILYTSTKNKCVSGIHITQMILLMQWIE